MSTEIHLLGRFEAVVDGRSVPGDAWKGRQASALVKLLALAPGRSLHRERVVDALWPGLAVADAAPRLHKAAHYARRALGHDDALVLRAETVSLLPRGDVVIDVARFLAAAEQALAGDSEQTAQDALRAYDGELLPGDLYEDWAEADRDVVRSRYQALLRRAGRWSELVVLEPSD